MSTYVYIESLDSLHEYQKRDIFIIESIGTVRAIEQIHIGDTLMLGVNYLPC